MSPQRHRQRAVRRLQLVAFLLCCAVLGGLMLQKYLARRAVVPGGPLEQASRQVVLFFAAADGSGLIREGRELEREENRADEVEELVQELASGPLGELQAVLPEEFPVHGVQVIGDLAVLDIAAEALQRIPNGSNAATLALYALVDSICASFPEIQRVQLLADGQPVELFGGHLDVREPLAPDYTLERTAGGSEGGR